MLYPMLLLINETAAKTHDIIELKWADIDFKNHRIIFHQEEKLQQRIIDVSEKWLSAIKQLDQMSEYVFTNLEGRQHYKHTLVRELRLFKRELGIEKDWVYRDLRHSFAINFLKAGSEIEYLQKVLGHHHVMTKDLYGRYKTQTVDFFDSAAVPETWTSPSENADFE